MIIDTHAHLNTKDYDFSLVEVLDRSKQNRVNNIIVIGMDKTSNQLAIELAKQHKMLFATVGVHPSYVDNETTDHLSELLKFEKVVAIGECGIDLYWRKDNLDLQKKIFIEQIELAVKTNLPLVIHVRSSFDQVYNCLLPYKGKVKGVFHCFSSNVDDAKKVIDLGFSIGVGGPVTFKNANELKQIVKQIDLKHILVETDSPYLTPMPYRGKKNEPGYTLYVVEKIAEIKGISTIDVAKKTTNNAIELFNLGGII